MGSPLQVNDYKDIDTKDLCNELKAIEKDLKKNSGPLNIPKDICEQKLIASFPNAHVALRILMTLPVCVAREERSFSKLK